MSTMEKSALYEVIAEAAEKLPEQDRALLAGYILGTVQPQDRDSMESFVSQLDRGHTEQLKAKIA